MLCAVRVSNKLKSWNENQMSHVRWWWWSSRLQWDGSVLLLRPPALEPKRCSEGSESSQVIPWNWEEYVGSRAGAEQYLRNRRGGGTPSWQLTPLSACLTSNNMLYYRYAFVCDSAVTLSRISLINGQNCDSILKSFLLHWNLFNAIEQFINLTGQAHGVLSKTST